jgi:hypothetical protein
LVQPQPTWHVDANGNWSLSGNWTGGVPNAPGATAVFGEIITEPRTVTVDVPITVGRLQFDNPNSYTVAGGNALTLDAIAGEAQIDVSKGSHRLSAPLSLADNTTIGIAPGASILDIIQPLTAPAVTLTKQGAGTLTMNALNVQGLSIHEGLVRIEPNSGTSLLSALSIGAPANVDNEITEPLGVIGVQAVPEPATITLLAIALTAALGHAAATRMKRQRRVVSLSLSPFWQP